MASEQGIQFVVFAEQRDASKCVLQLQDLSVSAWLVPRDVMMRLTSKTSRLQTWRQWGRSEKPQFGRLVIGFPRLKSQVVPRALRVGPGRQGTVKYGQKQA